MQKVDLLLINPPFHTRNGGGNFFPLGLSYIISSVNAQSFTWDVLDCTKMTHSFYKEDLDKFKLDLMSALQEHDPLLIGVGPCITSQLRALKIIVQCCRVVFPTIPIVAGGPLASISGQEWLFYEELGINFIIKGDGELAIPSAIKAIKETGSIERSCLVSRPGYSHVNRIENIDTISFPYRGFLENDTYSIRRTVSDDSVRQCAMITSRGCPYACNYCVSGNLSQKVRKRSNENIINEMELLHNTYEISDIIFYDDCFFSSIKDINDTISTFCNLLLSKHLGMKWQIELRPDMILALNNDSICLLSDSGCRQINIGIEKVSEKGLKFLGKSPQMTGLQKKLRGIKEISGIQLSGTFILGGGNETRGDIISLISKSTELGLDYAHYNPLFLYPGTPLYKSVFNNDREWAQIILNDTLPLGEIIYENSSLSRFDLLNLVDYAYAEFYKGTELAGQEMVEDRFNIKRRG